MKLIMSFFLLVMPFELSIKPNNLTIVDNDQTIKTVEREEYLHHYIGTPFIHEKKVKQLMKKIKAEIYEPPLNAKLNEKGEIVEEQTGLTLNQTKFHRLFLQYIYNGKPTKIYIPKTKVYPRVDSELLANISENRLHFYETYYNESNEERSHNIFLSTAAINNHVVFPGEEFSFNKVVGQRTGEKGYMKAPVIVEGEFSEDIGGGICQVSSTLYNAVHLKGIEIVERYSHSRSVPYVPPGKDATVSWWGPDFVFKNNYNQPLLIYAHAKNGIISIGIYSAEDVSYKH